jgi:hypothetical protein
MRQYLNLILLAPSTISAMLCLVMVAPINADTATWVRVSKDYTCMRTPTREPKTLVCRRVNAAGNSTREVIDLTKAPTDAIVDDEVSPDGSFPLTFDLTDEESEASVALFGCDCPTCIRSLRKLRSLTS